MPFDIPVTATGFGAPFQPPPAGNLLPRFRNRDLIRAAIMAGHRNGAGNGPDPLIRAWRIATIKLAVQHAQGNQLIHPRAWNRLDPTEKGQIRNLLGNTISKLLCERLLQAPLMVFLDVYGAQYGFRYGRARPDFIAQRLGVAWFTVEAKGRDRMAGQIKLETIKQQQALVLPAAQPGQLQAHVVSWIGQRRNQVVAAFHDPEPFNERDLPPLETASLVKAYYAPLLDILSANNSIGSMSLEREVTVEGADFTIGLHPKIAWLLKDNQHEKVAEVLSNFVSTESGRSSMETEGYGPDGIKIVPGDSWPKESNE